MKHPYDHVCHRPNCGKPVPPSLVACKSCWFLLPADLRAAVWRNYVPGQEISKTPTAAYIEALKACMRWWDENAPLPARLF